MKRGKDRKIEREKRIVPACFTSGPGRTPTATEYVFWHEFAFRPEQRLSCPRLSVFSLAHVAKPFVVRIVRQPAVLQPFVDELVRRVVVQRRSQVRRSDMVRVVFLARHEASEVRHGE